MLSAVASVLLSATLPFQALTPAQIFQKCSKGVVTVETKDRTGTGFFIYPAVICTCFHVVSGESEATVKMSDGTVAHVENVAGIDRLNDVALLVLDKPGAPLTWGDSAKTQIGDPLVVIGSPEGLSQTLTSGLLSARRQYDSQTLLQLSAGISPGSSGSPVINSGGQVIGMVTSTMKDGQLLNFALPGEAVQHAMGISMDIACANPKSKKDVRDVFLVAPWASQVKLKIELLQIQLGDCSPSKWTVSGISQEVAQTAIGSITNRYEAVRKFLQYAINVATEIEGNPKNLGNWLRLNSAVDQISSYAEVFANYATESDYQTDIGSDTYKKLLDISGGLATLSANGPAEPLIKFLEEM